MENAVKVEKYVAKRADKDETIKLLNIPLTTGSCLLPKTFLRFGIKKSPKVKEKPLCICECALVALTIKR